jgi:formate hydrogenlyase subunit 3/multisubunit Na+/H+ antiporter MnhD subunit
LRIITFISGVLIASVGGVILYRTLYVEPRSTVVITESSIRELPNYLHIAGGIIMLIIGAVLAFYSGRTRRT